MALDFFGPTIRTWWNSQNSNLKKTLTYYLEGLFGIDTFNKSTVTATAGQYFKISRQMYRVQLQKNPKYERPPMIPDREWKALIKDTKEKKMKKEGKTPLGPTRYITF